MGNRKIKCKSSSRLVYSSTNGQSLVFFRDSEGLRSRAGVTIAALWSSEAAYSELTEVDECQDNESR